PLRRPPRSPLFPYPTLFRSLGLHTRSRDRNGMATRARQDGGDAATRRPPAPPALAASGPAHRRTSGRGLRWFAGGGCTKQLLDEDRKSTRLNSSHVAISYAV